MSENQSKHKRDGYKGYTVHHSFGPYQIPVNIQNLILRDYAKQRGLLYKLGLNEFIFPHCYLRLESLLQELPSLEGLLICSVFILPKNQKRRFQIYETIIQEQTVLHVVFENKIVESFNDVDQIEELILLTQTLDSCPKSIPSELLPSVKFTESF